jgi:hypothetical protein
VSSSDCLFFSGVFSGGALDGVGQSFPLPADPLTLRVVPEKRLGKLHRVLTDDRADRRPLLGRDLLHVDEAAQLDSDEQRVDGALGDVGEALIPQPSRDLVAVRGPAGQNREEVSALAT